MYFVRFEEDDQGERQPPGTRPESFGHIERRDPGCAFDAT